MASLSTAAFGAVADMVDEGLPKLTTDATVSSQSIPVTGAYMPKEYSTALPASTTIHITKGGGNSGSGYGNVRGKGNGAAAPLANTASINNSDTDDEDSTCNPVILATGEKFKDEADFASQGEYGLGLTRTYRSMSTTGMIFGANWSSSLDPLVITPSTAACVPFEDGNCYPRDATISFPGGAKYKYVWNFSDSYYLVSGNAGVGKLQYVGSQNRWKLVRDGNTYEFQYSGPMNRVLDPNNMALLTYTWVLAGQYQVTKVTNAVGQYVQFTWTSGKMTTARDPNGGLWSYTYNANNMLATVSSPDSPPSTRTYHYEDTLDIKLLTGITINGTRYSTYKYYSDKRVKESGLATAEERDTFSYTTNSTTVTSAKGDATTYTFTGPAGAKKLAATSRPATASCAAANASIAYDANGYRDYAFDWNNNKSDYTYDTTGKLTQTTTAAGTADAIHRN